MYLKQIKRILRKGKVTNVSIARELEVHPVTVGQVLAGRTISARVLELATRRAEEVLAEEARLKDYAVAGNKAAKQVTEAAR